MKPLIFFSRALVLSALFFSAAFASYAQTAGAIEFPSMPSVPRPTFPAIPQTPQTPQATQSDRSAQNRSGASADTGNSALSSLTNPITAAALSALGLSTSEDLINSISGYSPDSALERLERLEAARALAAESAETREQPKSAVELLRFTVNGFDLLPTIKTILSSLVADDGSFLITGDRVYTADYSAREETFYFFFTKNSLGEYEASVKVRQDYLNEYSFLYRISRLGTLKARVSANMLVILADTEDLRIDLLARAEAPFPTGNSGL